MGFSTRKFHRIYEVYFQSYTDKIFLYQDQHEFESFISTIPGSFVM